MDRLWEKHDCIDKMEAVESEQRDKLINRMSSFKAKNHYEQNFLINSLYYLDKLIDMDFNEMYSIEDRSNRIYKRLYPDAVVDYDDETK